MNTDMRRFKIKTGDMDPPLAEPLCTNAYCFNCLHA